jgi:hypothetical protein
MIFDNRLRIQPTPPNIARFIDPLQIEQQMTLLANSTGAIMIFDKFIWGDL